jgi:hypothetical protein
MLSRQCHRLLRYTSGLPEALASVPSLPKGEIRAGADRDAEWGYSEHHGWVYGYSFEVVVSSNPNTMVFPLLAPVDTASAAEVRTFPEKIGKLPEDTRYVSADAAYDANVLGERTEYDEQDRRTGRHFALP